MILQCKESGEFKPHPEGIYAAICNDVIDLGLVETEFQGQKRLVNKIKVSFETELKMEDGKPFAISKNFTASLHPKAKLAEFLGKWRGRPVLPGETIDLSKLIGANCTLVISQQQNLVGKTYASIDAVSKPTKKLALSGAYDPAAARQRVAEWKQKQQAEPAETSTSPQPSPRSGEGVKTATQASVPARPKSQPAAAAPDYDPEVGF